MTVVRRSHHLLCIAILLVSAVAAFGQNQERIIVSSSGSRDALKTTIQNLGGTITHEYQNVNAVSATISPAGKAALDAMPDYKVAKDVVRVLTPERNLHGETPAQSVIDNDGTLQLDEAAIKARAATNDYSFNNTLINATTVQAGGNLGQGVIVAVIDSGTANWSGVPTLSGTVIGGQNFSGDGVSATSRSNGPHGTWVGTMIAGHAAFLISKTSCLGASLAYNAPTSIQDGAPNYPTSYILPVIGVAPGASIYALKVFPYNTGSTASSRIMAAMDRAITMKKNFLAGQPPVPVSGSGTETDPFVYDSLNIQVVNMSLGGETMIAGRDVEDQLVQQMVAAGITVAVSSGNAGPSGLTSGSPSTSFASISSAAASTPTHERILRDYQYCSPGFGKLYRPSDAIQTAYFSSRGPTADGRVGIGVTTAGDNNFAQGANGGLYFVSGTSFSAPTVAGAAALVRNAVPSASAAQVRNAIILAANHKVLGDDSTVFDQGAGYLDVAATIDLLQKVRVPGIILPSLFPSGDVEQNLHRLFIWTGNVNPGRTLDRSVHKLLPGERGEFYLDIDKDTASININVNSVTPENDAATQNQLFGDDLILAVHSAKTSSIGEGDYKVFTLVNGPGSFTIPNPEPGIMRVTFVGDWTNAGRVSADFSVTATRKDKPNFRSAGRVAEGQTVNIPFDMPPGKSEAAFEMTFKYDWGAYPTDDLDMILVAPDGTVNYDAATINGLERAVIANPQAGRWTIQVNGFTIYDRVRFDRFKKDMKANTDDYRVEVFLK
jgi:hypothetical protein